MADDQTTFLPPSLMEQYRGHGLRARTFTYAWCGVTETDYVCTRCDTIVLDGVTCQQCAPKVRALSERSLAFFASRKEPQP